MQQVLAILSLVTQLLPALINAVKAVEAALPQTGQGPAKLAMVQAWLEAAFNALEGTTVTFQQVWPALQTTVMQVVNIFNSLGEFKKTA